MMLLTPIVMPLKPLNKEEQERSESRDVDDVILAPQETCVAIASGIIIANIKAVNNTIPPILMPFSNIWHMLILYINFYMIE